MRNRPRRPQSDDCGAEPLLASDAAPAEGGPAAGRPVAEDLLRCEG
jgi:hypothetical protein